MLAMQTSCGAARCQTTSRNAVVSKPLMAPARPAICRRASRMVVRAEAEGVPIEKSGCASLQFVAARTSKAGVFAALGLSQRASAVDTAPRHIGRPTPCCYPCRPNMKASKEIQEIMSILPHRYLALG